MTTSNRPHPIPIRAHDLAGAVFDGGLGTLLQQRGLEGGQCGELWNVENPEAVLRAHREYLRAGADLITTNTFGGTRPRLDMHGIGDRVHELNLAGARLARRAADGADLGADLGADPGADHDGRRDGGHAGAGRRALVAGGLGPTGELLEPLGELTEDGAGVLFAEQLTALVEGGIDLVLIETLSDLGELRAAVQACREAAPGLPVIATMSFDTNLHTMMGVAPTAAVRAAVELGLTGLGANCGNGPLEMEQVMTEMVAARAAAGAPELLLIAQSNAGMPQLQGDTFVYDAAPADLAAHAVRLRDLGVDVIGACCGSTPEHVAAMHGAVRGRDPATGSG